MSGAMRWGGSVPGPANPVVYDGKVFVSTERDKTLRVFEAGRRPKLLSEDRLPSPPGTPVFADGVCYFPTQRRMLAIQYDEPSESGK